MGEKEKDFASLKETEQDVSECAHVFDDGSYERRKKASRLFAMFAVVVLAVWGASFFQRVFPHRVEVRYIYRDVPHVQRLTKVSTVVRDEEGVLGRAAFFHYAPISNRGERYFRKQTLKLAKGAYNVSVVLHYKKGSSRTLATRLTIRGAGRYYIYLKHAK